MRIKTIAFTAVLGLMLVACGGGEKTVTTGALDATTTTATAATTTTTATAGSDSTIASASTSGSDSAWCAVAKEVEAKSEGLSFEGTSPAELETSFRELGAALERAQAEAPAEIKSEVATSSTAFNEFLAEMEAVKFNMLDLDMSIISKLEAVSAATEDPIEAYNEKVCGIPAKPDEDDGSEPLVGTGRDQVVAALVAAGIAEDKARCVADKMTPEMAGAEESDPQVLALLADCGITPPA